ncbi:MAG: hypothetical protein LBE20_00630 [Deltaproteobacteria bacterium]|jgi:hypothetical protein|nr:hypothetical protein [Deltaproteobacteria bacterium]
MFTQVNISKTTDIPDKIDISKITDIPDKIDIKVSPVTPGNKVETEVGKKSEEKAYKLIKKLNDAVNTNKQTTEIEKELVNHLMELLVISGNGRFVENIVDSRVSYKNDKKKSFKENYLYPRTRITRVIGGAPKLVKKYSYSVNANSQEKLKDIGFNFSLEKDQLVAKVGILSEYIEGKDRIGQETEFSKDILVTMHDGKDISGSEFKYDFNGTEKGVEITEKSDGIFEFKINYKEETQQPSVVFYFKRKERAANKNDANLPPVSPLRRRR